MICSGKLSAAESYKEKYKSFPP